MDSDHIVKKYDDELQQLDAIIAEMGGVCETQLSQALGALKSRDAAAAHQAAAVDRQIDTLEAEVNALTLRILALRQPMADDLRVVVGALKIAADLERIGDYTRNMANRTEVISEYRRLGGTIASIVRMGIIVQNMIKNVLDAYVARDVVMADDVRLRDEEVDQLHTSLFREVLTYMIEDPRTITACTHLLFIAKNIERIGDHVTNIAENVHMIVLGEVPQGKRPKGDLSSFTVVEMPTGSADIERTDS